MYVNNKLLKYHKFYTKHFIEHTVESTLIFIKTTLFTSPASKDIIRLGNNNAAIGTTNDNASPAFKDIILLGNNNATIGTTNDNASPN